MVDHQKDGDTQQLVSRYEIVNELNHQHESVETDIGYTMLNKDIFLFVARVYFCFHSSRPKATKRITRIHTKVFKDRANPDLSLHIYSSCPTKLEFQASLGYACRADCEGKPVAEGHN